MVLSIAFLNKDALRIHLLDDVFAGVREVQDAVVVLDALLVRFLDQVVGLPVEVEPGLPGGR